MKSLFPYLLVLCFASVNCLAQKVSAGFTIGPNFVQQMKWDVAYFAPDNSYHTYIESNSGEGLINKISVLNGGHIGGVLFVDYKRFGFGMEPQYHYQRTYLSFDRPDQINRIIGKKSFRLPTYFTFRLFKKPKSAYVILGMNLVKETIWDIQDPGFDYSIGESVIYENQVQVGSDHFGGILYDNGAYWNYVIGFGKKLNNWNSSIRFQSNLDITKHSVQANIWQLELSFNFLFLSTKDFTEKHFLYEDE
jgi:hypothetical protein